jgi:antitoxin Phd
MDVARRQGAIQRGRAPGAKRRAAAVSVRGKDAVVVMSVEDMERLAGEPSEAPLVSFLEGLYLHELDLTREPDLGRDLDL